jgi:hypothetical protein
MVPLGYPGTTRRRLVGELPTASLKEDRLFHREIGVFDSAAKYSKLSECKRWTLFHRTGTG